MLLVIKVVQNSIADTFLETRSFYEVSRTFQSKVGISTQKITNWPINQLKNT